MIRETETPTIQQHGRITVRPQSADLVNLEITCVPLALACKIIELIAQHVDVCPQIASGE